MTAMGITTVVLYRLAAARGVTDPAGNHIASRS